MNRSEKSILIEYRKLPLAGYIVNKHNNPAKGRHLQLDGSVLRVVANDRYKEQADNFVNYIVAQFK